MVMGYAEDADMELLAMLSVPSEAVTKYCPDNVIPGSDILHPYLGHTDGPNMVRSGSYVTGSPETTSFNEG